MMNRQKEKNLLPEGRIHVGFLSGKAGGGRLLIIIHTFVIYPLGPKSPLNFFHFHSGVN